MDAITHQAFAGIDDDHHIEGSPESLSQPLYDTSIETQSQYDTAIFFDEEGPSTQA
jgi:hypothetical protein